MAIGPARRGGWTRWIGPGPLRALLLTFAAGALAGGLLVGLMCSGGEVRREVIWPNVPDPVATPPAAYDWTAQPPPTFPIPPYAAHLAGVKIVLDPGHAGQHDPGGTWRRGPTGVRETDVNLRVAHFLREFLVAVGAEVHFTREVDKELGLSYDEDLRERAAIANALRADLLLSIHHNGHEDPEPNYTLVFYHGDVDDNPASAVVARHLLDGLNDALRLERHVPCAVVSDHTIIPRKGYAVLRHAEVPAVITEASFHSNPEEEARLRDPVYNRREAYGLFLGLARWAQGGLPRVTLVEPANGRVKPGARVTVGIDDGLSARGGLGAGALRVREASVVVELDGTRLPFTVDLKKGRLRVKLPERVGKTAHLRVDFQNVFGHHVVHPVLALRRR